MTTPDKMKRAVKRLTKAAKEPAAWSNYHSEARTDDLRLLLSERAELLAAVERMRGGLETISKRAGQLFERSEKLRANDARAVRRIADFADAEARAALTTGEEK